METHLVYVATNKIDGKQYVGLTQRTLAQRWYEHTGIARRFPKSHFHYALAKYGADAFDVQHVASATKVEHLADLERLVIADMQPEYNQTNGGELTVGKKYTPEIIARIAEKNRGQKRTAESREMNRMRKQDWWDRHPEEKAAAAEHLAAVRVKVDNVKRIAAVRAARVGVPLSAEQRAKMSATRLQRGMRHTPEVLARIVSKIKRPILCVTTGEVYDCRVSAAVGCGVSPQSVFRVCNGKYPSVKGLAFSYA
jgi:predicted GIY-YIG superfamily endonuclease